MNVGLQTTGKNLQFTPDTKHWIDSFRRLHANAKTQTFKFWKKKKKQSNLNSCSETYTSVLSCHQIFSRVCEILRGCCSMQDRKQHQPWAPGETQQPPTDPAVPTHTYTQIYPPTYVHNMLHKINAHTYAHSLQQRQRN